MTDAKSPDSKPLLLSQRFAPLFWCQFFSAFSDNFLKNALVFLILLKIGGEAAESLITLAAAVFIAPYFFLSAFGGEMADRFDKAVVAQRLKAEIRAATSLTASAGVAPNKFLAKIASAWRKPDGLTVIAPERMETFLQQLPVDALWGVGPVTAARLRDRGITRLVDVRTIDPNVLEEAVGSSAGWLRQLADGIDDRPVVSEYEPKSSGSENTFSQDLTDILEIRLAIDDMARDAAQWLARKELLCRTVTIKVRYSDFTTVTRSHSAGATRDAEDLAQRAVALLDKTEAGRRPVRLLGASVHNLIDPDTPTEEPWLPFGEGQ